MSEHLDLDQMQAAYKAAVEEWIAAIKAEEALASVTHTVAEVDKWEGASFKEDELRGKVKAAKKRYEDFAAREAFRLLAGRNAGRDEGKKTRAELTTLTELCRQLPLSPSPQSSNSQETRKQFAVTRALHRPIGLLHYRTRGRVSAFGRNSKF